MPDRIQFKIHGMDCAEEVAVLRRELGPLVGGERNLAFDVLQGRLTVSGSGLEASAIMGAIHRTGMRAGLWQATDASAPVASRWWDARTVVTVASGVLTVAGFATHAAMNGGVAAALGSEGLGATAGVPLIAKLFYIGAVVSGAWFVLPKALYSLRRLRPRTGISTAPARGHERPVHAIFRPMRIPSDADQRSELMPIAIPISCRSPFQSDGDHRSNPLPISFGVG